MRNANQILTIMTATFGEELFDTTASDAFCLQQETDVEDLACRWRRLAESLSITKSDVDLEWTTAMSQVRPFDILSLSLTDTVASGLRMHRGC